MTTTFKSLFSDSQFVFNNTKYNNKSYAMASNADETTICRTVIATLCFGYFFANAMLALSMSVPKRRPAIPNVSDSITNVGMLRGSSTFPSNGRNDVGLNILYFLKEIRHRLGPGARLADVDRV